MSTFSSLLELIETHLEIIKIGGTGLLAAGGALWFAARSYLLRENKKAIGIAFRETVTSLSSEKIEVRMASAILLRRYFDRESELGIGGAPFAPITVNVISALLKTLQTSDFQKLLADGLRYAPPKCLRKGDFQRANLSKAFLSGKEIDMQNADFFQANLSGASFAEANLRNAQFFQAILSGTVFRNSKLEDANFKSATLEDIKFTGANLTGAKFNGAVLRNVDFTGANITNASFQDVKGYNIRGIPNDVQPDDSDSRNNPHKIFISRPGILDVRQKLLIDQVKDLLNNKDYQAIELLRDSYDRSGVLSKLSDRMRGCQGMIVFGFSSLHVTDGNYRYNTDDARSVQNSFYSSPWNHIEAGMGLMKGVPVLLLVDEGINEGIFDQSVNDAQLHRLEIKHCLNNNYKNVHAWLDAFSTQGPGQV